MFHAAGLTGICNVRRSIRLRLPLRRQLWKSFLILPSIICSAVPECRGTIRPVELNHWPNASKIDVSIVRSPLGVAETGSVLLSDVELQVNTIAFLSHDLVVLLDPSQIVRNIHEAYRHPYFKTRPYGLLMTGPSGSGDIGGVIVHPAQGVKTLTVVFIANSRAK
jgi:L-lactate dehydrogenase complex protein LldG